MNHFDDNVPETPKVNILIVDDLPEKLLVFETILEDLQENLIKVSSGREALQQILLHDFAVILLDVNMPDIDGFETATLIRQYHKTRKTPIIFITSYIDDIQTARGYALGAVDYIAAPVVPEVLRSKVQVFVDLRRMHMQLQLQSLEREALARAEAARNSAEAATRRADLLADVSHALGRSLDIDATASELLQFITDNAADTAALVFADERNDMRCALLAQRRPHYEQTSLQALPSPLHERVFGADHNDAEASPIDIAGALTLTTAEGASLALDMQRTAIFPLARGQRLRGALILFDRDGRDIFPADAALVREVVSRAAIALENALLYRAILEGDRRKGEFLAMLAHELRNPLAPVRNAVAVLQHPEKGAQYVDWAGEIIARQVEHMARLMDDLLDVSRISRGKLALDLKTIFVADFVRHSVEAVQPLITERGHHLTVEIPEHPIAVQGDTVRLSQIVSNLLHNAAKYSPRGSAIAVSATFADGTVRIAVRDNGEGIAPDLLPNIFDMFTQGERALDRKHGGLGVGLTLVKNLIELHGGRVEAHSDGLHQGAEFAVYLPARRIFAISEVKKPHAAMPASAAQFRVLIIDDLIESAESMARYLELKGFSVDVAFDGPTGLEKAATFDPAVILLDIGMPGMDGYEVARSLRESWGESPRPLLIALTGYGAEEDLQRALAVGFDLHYVKPVNIETLLATISAHCAQQSGIERTVTG